MCHPKLEGWVVLLEIHMGLSHRGRLKKETQFSRLSVWRFWKAVCWEINLNAPKILFETNNLQVFERFQSRTHDETDASMVRGSLL